MKKIYKVLIIVSICLLVVGSGITYFITMIQKGLENVMNLEISTLDLSGVDDGIYQGEYSAFPIKVIVDVTIENHLITNIQIIKHDTGQGKPAEVIIDDVIDAQSSNVDLISGASYSSQIILLAIDDAIN